MNELHKRYILFLVGCMGARSLLAYGAKNIDPILLPKLGYAAMIPIVGWLYIMFISPRDTGPEVFGGRIWWQDLRIIHVALYSMFAYGALHNDTLAWRYLAMDVLVGLTAFIWHHFT